MVVYGGYSGFERENVRQTSLAGRRFREADKSARLHYFHQNNIYQDSYRVGKQVDPPGAVSSVYVTGAESSHDVASTTQPKEGGRMIIPRRPPSVMGEKNNYGIPSPAYNIISGHTEKATGTGPHFGYFGSKRPLHGLPTADQHSILKASSFKDSTRFAPNSSTTGVGEVTRQYTSAAQALKPPGQGPMDNYKEDAKEYFRYEEMQNDFSANKRPMIPPQERFLHPMTSSQNYGWNLSSLPKFEQTHGIRMCRETRRAQSHIIGARHSQGYAGQGTL